MALPRLFQIYYLRLKNGFGDLDVQKANDDGGVETQPLPHCNGKSMSNVTFQLFQPHAEWLQLETTLQPLILHPKLKIRKHGTLFRPGVAAKIASLCV